MSELRKGVSEAMGAEKGAGIARSLLRERARKPGLGVADAKRPRLAATRSQRTSGPLAARPSRQLLISDLLKADRAARAQKNAPGPSLVSAHSSSDAKARDGPSQGIPEKQTGQANLSKTQPARTRTGKRAATQSIGVTHADCLNLGTPKKRKVVSIMEDLISKRRTSGSKPPLPPPVRPAAARTPVSNVSPSELVRPAPESTKIRASGAEALRYDRSLLPSKLDIMLDMMDGMEQAISLLMTRHATPDFAAVGEIVSRATKRTFSLRHLAQIAALVPEAVAVIHRGEAPHSGSPRSKAAAASAAALAARRNDRLIIRLDDVSSIVNGQKQAKSRAPSVQPTTAARNRRRLLHSRLLEHVDYWHARYLKRSGIEGHASVLWHEGFDTSSHVPDLAAPSLYRQSKDSVDAHPDTARNYADAIRPSAKTSVVDELLLDNSETTSPSMDDSLTMVNSDPQRHSETKLDGADGCPIPKSLLARVRAREAAKAVRAAEAPARDEKLLLHRLLGTMDVVRSILANESRSAMGWTALVVAAQSAHPEQFSFDEIAEQLDAVAKLGKNWCKKRALSGPRGGYAFCIIAQSAFSSARSAVAAATSIP